MDILSNLGVLSLKQGEGQKAIDYFTKVLQIEPDHLEARNNIAATFLKNHLFENAIPHYLEYLQKEPDNIEANFNLGVAYASCGKLKDATNHYEKVLNLVPSHSEALANMGVIAIKEGDSETAIGHLKKSQSLNPDNTQVQFMLEALQGTKAPSKAPHDYVENLFDHYALYYDKHMVQTLHYSLPQKLFEFYKEMSPTNENHLTILDLGCGTGLCGEYFKPISNHITGIDLSKPMIDMARKKEVYSNLLQGDFHEKIKELDKFSIIIAAEVFCYLGDLEKTFKVLSNHLQKDGTLLFSIEKGDKYPYSLQKTMRYTHDEKYISEILEKLEFKTTIKKTQTRLEKNQEKEFLLFCAVKK